MFVPPKELLSDQGREFLNQTVTELSKICGIERKVTAPYSPRTNGLPERFNQTLIASLKTHAEHEPANWDKWLPYVLLMTYRSQIHKIKNLVRSK